MTRGWRIGASALAIVVFLGVAYTVSHNLPQTPAKLETGIALNAVQLAATTQVSSTTPIESSTATTTALKVSVKGSIASSTSSKAPASSQASVELSNSGGALLRSLVNIVCVSQVPSIPSISGTGVIIDSRGIILTAAHVAQEFLLSDYLGKDKVECLIRTGSPARRAYLAEPIFISPSWINTNPLTLVSKAPVGNGQYDVALLGITATATSTPLPSSFPALSLGSSQPTAHEQVAIGSYGAQYLTGKQLNLSLYPILVFGSIANRYTYNAGSVDLFSIQGTAASQEGSSGGGVVDPNGRVIGIITTSSTEGSVQSRVLNAVSMGHVRDTYSTDTGKNLDGALSSQSVSQLIAGFSSQTRQLGKQLYTAISSHN